MPTGSPLDDVKLTENAARMRLAASTVFGKDPMFHSVKLSG